MNSNLYLRGSEWRKWDLHIHTPGTAKNDNYPNDDEWTEFLNALEEKDMPDEDKKNIAVIGITDYFSIENYKKAVGFQQAGRLAGKTLLPNIELRITPVTDRNIPINLHIIFDPSIDTSIIEREFLQKLTFQYNGSNYSLLNDNLIALGQAINANTTIDEVTARKVAIRQLNIPYTDVRDVLKQSTALQGSFLVAVSNSSNDGNSGIQESALRTTRCEIYRMADIIFSSNPNDVDFFLGKKNTCPADIIRDYGSLKPCVNGSDAHDISKINIFENNRYTWIKADPTFEGLKQIIYEPSERVCIQDFPPEYKSGYEVVDRIVLSGKSFGYQELPINSNLVTIIGGRSSGKSTLLEGIARAINPECCKNNKSLLQNTERERFFSEISKEINVKWKDNNDAVREVDYYCQEYMFDIARDVNESDKLISRILNEHSEFSSFIQGLSNFENANHSELIYKCNELISLVKKQREAVKPEADKKGLEDEIRNLKQQLETIRKSGFALTEEEQVQFDVIGKQINNGRKLIVEIESDIRVISEIADEDAISSLFISKVSRLNSSIGVSIKQSIIELCSKVRDEFQKNIAAKKLQLESEKHKQEEYVENQRQSVLYQKGLSVFAENNRLNDLYKKLESEEGRLHKLEQWEIEQQQLNKEIEQCIVEIINLHLKYQEKLICKEIRIKDEIVIKAIAKLHLEEITAFLSSRLNKHGGEKKDFVENYATKYGQNPKQAVSEIIQRYCNKSLDCIAGNKPEDILSDFITRNWHSYSYDIIYQNDTFADMSPGKKSYIILRLLLDYSKKTCPILIDQPEDSLDNRAIYSELVQYLKKKKKERQIILVTHNPNVVVGTDAEQVIIANQNGINSCNDYGVKFQYISGSLENTMPKNTNERIILKSQGIREHVCEILEGGEDAFEKREKKYGFDKG